MLASLDSPEADRGIHLESLIFSIVQQHLTYTFAQSLSPLPQRNSSFLLKNNNTIIRQYKEYEIVVFSRLLLMEFFRRLISGRTDLSDKEDERGYSSSTITRHSSTYS